MGDSLCILNKILTNESWGKGVAIDNSSGMLDFDKALPLEVYKLETLPEACTANRTLAAKQKNDASNAVEVLEVMFQHFSEHYAFTISREIDWQTIESQWLQRVSEKTTADELAKIIDEFLRFLRDGHAILVDEQLNRIAHYPPRESAVEQRVQDYLSTHSDFTQDSQVYRFFYRNWVNNISAYFDKQYRPLRLNDNFTFAKIKGNFAYLRLESFDEHNTKEVMEKLTPEMMGTNGVIIDLRDSSGGNDQVAMAVASYFTGKKIKVGGKQFKTKSGMSKTQDIYLSPGNSVAYTGNIVIITSQQTPSAAEVFLVASKARGNTTIIGEPSNGAFSDALTKTLPNGWAITLSNEVFLDSEGKSFEFTGVPVDKYFEFPSISDIENNKDSALEYAVELLRDKESTQ